MRIVSKYLSFSYDPKKKPKDRVYALKDLSLTIEQGEFFGIIGQTGSGKSTFIQHLNALIPLQEGELFVGDYDLNPKQKGYKKMLKSLRSRVGMVFQYPEYQLFAETVYKDVAFGVKNFFPELSDSQVTRRVGDALTMVGLNYSAIKDKSPFELSGGQKRRIAIAGVIATDPEVLVLDEPVAGLDPVGKNELMQVLHTLNTPERTVIIVSHDMDEVCENCSRIAVFGDGKLQTSGTPEEVFSFELANFGSNDGAFNRLSLPLVAKIKNSLKKEGVTLDCPLKTNFVIDEIQRQYRIKSGKN